MKKRTYHKVILENNWGKQLKPECLYTKAEIKKRVTPIWKKIGFKTMKTIKKTIKLIMMLFILSGFLGCKYYKTITGPNDECWEKKTDNRENNEESEKDRTRYNPHISGASTAQE